MLDFSLASGGHLWAALLLPMVLLAWTVAGEENDTVPAVSGAELTLADTDYPPIDYSDPEVQQWLDELEDARVSRSPRTKFDPIYHRMGIGKRVDPEGRPAKYGNSYKWIGLGKKRGDGPRKFGPQYKFIGLGKRGTVKYNQNYKWIGLGKRMAPYFTSQLLNDWLASEKAYKNEAGEKWAMSGVAGAGIAKKFTEEPPMEDIVAEEKSMYTGRPSARGGQGPIYNNLARYVGLG